jgi:hypothetical protein
MTHWLKRFSAALGVALLWGLAWAVIGGGIMEGIIDPDGKIVDMWPQVLGIVGALGGFVFAGIVGIGSGRRSLQELTFKQFATLGAAAGVLQGVLAMLLVGAPLLFIGVAVLGSAATGAGSLALARLAGPRKSRGELGRGS